MSDLPGRWAAPAMGDSRSREGSHGVSSGEDPQGDWAMTLGARCLS